MKEMKFVKATRKRRKLRLAISALSGGGKTMSALRIAKGIIETEGGKIAMIDTENNSSALYDHIVDFDMVDIKPPYDLAEFNQAVKLAADNNYSVLIIDSASHAWERVQEIVAELTKSSKSHNSYFEWRKGNTIITRWLRNLLYFRGHIIYCMRSKMSYDTQKGSDGKINPQKIGLAPMMRDGIDYEFDLLMDGNQEHYFTVTKCRYAPFSDLRIEKPSETFGADIINYLNSAPESELPDVETMPEAVTETPPPAKVPEKVEEPKAEKKTKSQDFAKPNVEDAKFESLSKTKPESNPTREPDNKKYGVKSEPLDTTQTVKGVKMDLSGVLVYDPKAIKEEYQVICLKIFNGWRKLDYHDVHIANAMEKHIGLKTLAECESLETLNVYYRHLRQEWADKIKKVK